MKKRSVTHANFSIGRHLKQSPGRVFAAFATEKAKQAWFRGPEDWSDDHKMDFRVGGIETSVGGPPGGFVSSFRCLYQDIVPDERIVYSYDMDLDGDRISVSLTTIEFKPESENGTHLVFTEQGAYLDGWDKPGDREHGTNELLGNLERYLDSQ